MVFCEPCGKPYAIEYEMRLDNLRFRHWNSSEHTDSATYRINAPQRFQGTMASVAVDAQITAASSKCTYCC